MLAVEERENEREHGIEREGARGREEFVVFIHARGEAAVSIASPGIDGRRSDTEQLAVGERDKRDFFTHNPMYSSQLIANQSF